MLVNCRLDGSNQSLPASSGAAVSAVGGAHQAMHRIVGAMRIGDVALRAVHGELGVQAAAPADLHHVAELHRTGRLADDAEIGDLAVGLHPLQHAHRAVYCGAFFVARDQQADRAARRTIRQVLRGGGDEGGDAALHVACAAAVQDAVAHLAGERIGLPLCGADRDHVGMAGEADMRRSGADAREQVVDLAIAQRGDREAELPQRVGQHGLRAGIGGRHRSAADQRLGKRQGVVQLRPPSIDAMPPSRLPQGEGEHRMKSAPSPCGRGLGEGVHAQSRSSSLIEVFARVCSSTVLTMTAQ